LLATAGLDELLAKRLSLVRSAHAKNTVTSYYTDWGDFVAWCKRNKRLPLPASPETVSLYLTDLLTSRGRKVSTASRRTTSISYFHRHASLPSPINEDVVELLRGAQRARKEQPEAKTAITIEDLREICAHFGNSRTAIRNRAILLFGFATALRRSSIVALDLSDLRFGEKGMEIHIRAEKQDQEGKGRSIGVPPGRHPETCPVSAVKRWLKVRGDAPGPLFTHVASLKRLTSYVVAYIVRRSVAKIGLDPADYAAHSLRSGFITAAGEANVSHLMIMAHTGHKSLNALARYFRHKDVFKSNACAALDL
jgi:integrase